MMNNSRFLYFWTMLLSHASSSWSITILPCRLAAHQFQRTDDPTDT
jgi:hypothetical protein